MQQKLTFLFPKWVFIVILVLPLFLPIILISLQWQKGFPRLTSPCLLSSPNIVLLPLSVDAQDSEIVNTKNDIENQLTRLLQKDLGYNLRDRQKYEPLSQRNYQGDSTAKEQLLLLAKQDKIDLLIQGQLQRQDEKLGVSVEVFFCKTSQLKRLEMTFQDGAGVSQQVANYIVSHLRTLDPLTDEQEEVPKINTQWLSFAGIDIHGNHVTGEQLREKVVFLTFFTPECPHCITQAEALQNFYHRYHSQGIEIIGVALKSDVEAVLEFVQDLNLDYPLLLDERDGLYRLWNLENYHRTPVLFILDKTGQLRFVHQGYSEQQPLIWEAEVYQLLEPSEPFLFSDESFVGDDVCQVCHALEYADWTLTKHAHAYETLVKEKQEKNPECIGCHVTGYHKPGGYNAQRPWESFHLEAVQCEVCHGQGGPHVAEASSLQRRNPDYQAICQTCHQKEFSLNFAYDEAIQLVNHSLASRSEEYRQKMMQVYETTRFNRIGGRYVGSATCASCHQQEYEQWQATAHAHAFESLRSNQAVHKKECVPCHVTGFGKPGGYAIDRGDVDRENVGCESCHGPGFEHVKALNTQKKGTIINLGDKCDKCILQRICQGCHDSSNDPSFDLDTAIHFVKH